jgi:hypothetical protein
MQEKLFATGCNVTSVLRLDLRQYSLYLQEMSIKTSEVYEIKKRAHLESSLLRRQFVNF